MHINLESASTHHISSYSSEQVTIDGQNYTDSLLILPEKIHPHWKVTALHELTDDKLKVFSQTDIILIGYTPKDTKLDDELVLQVARLSGKAEVMNFGAACRTFNLLNTEGRDVQLGLIF